MLETVDRNQNSERKWPAHQVETWPCADLVPYVNNARTHPPEQIAQIASSIQRFGFTIPILVAEDGTVIAGHGRLLAAERLGIEDVPVIVARGWSDEDRRLYTIADNRLAETSEWDLNLLRIEVEELGIQGDEDTLQAIGFTDFELGEMLDSVISDDVFYTRKIISPVYEPDNDRPPVADLYDDSYTQELLSEIDQAELPKEVAAFLKLAAQRHTVFKFNKIADYYAHAPRSVQGLMERSALVIIDFDQAIENGFVQLSDKMRELAEAGRGQGDA